MASRIAQLRPSTASVLRSSVALPSMASIVAELVYNSLDAGATDIHVTLDVGAFSIAVRDDGQGIAAESLRLVGERHATSKLASLAQLEREGLRTYGFRGEALHLVASISVLDITSCCASSAPPHNLGSSSSSSTTTTTTYAARIRFGERVSCGAAPSQRGAVGTVVVRDCFLNRPVARKQLIKHGAQQAELERARRHLAEVALAQPSVSLHLIDGSKQACILNVPRSANLIGTLRRLTGGAELPPFVEVCEASADDFTLRGHVAVPVAGMRTRECQHVYLNGRPLSRRAELHRLCETAFSRVHDALTHEAAEAASSRLPSSVPKCEPSQRPHAAFILFIACAPSRYDLTLEPDKSDVVFADGGRAAAAFVLDALARGFAPHTSPVLPLMSLRHLLHGTLQRGSASASRRDTRLPRADGVQGRAQERASSAPPRTPPRRTGPTALAERPVPQPGGAPAHGNAPVRAGAPLRKRPRVARPASFVSSSVGDGRAESAVLRNEKACPGDPALLFDTSMLAKPPIATVPTRIEALADDAIAGATTEKGGVHHPTRHPNSATTPSTKVSITRAALRDLNVVGQWERKFIVARAAGRLFVVDQHAADERVQLERLARATYDASGRAIAGGGVEQRRLHPVERLHLSLDERALVRRYRARLLEWGGTRRGPCGRCGAADGLPRARAERRGRQPARASDARVRARPRRDGWWHRPTARGGAPCPSLQGVPARGDVRRRTQHRAVQRDTPRPGAVRNATALRSWPPDARATQLYAHGGAGGYDGPGGL